MENNKLLQVLKKLNSQELKSLEMYLNIPSFNKNTHVRILFDEVKKFAPSYRLNKINPELIYTAIHPNKKYSKVNFNHLCSLLYIATLNFLASTELKKQNNLKEMLLLKKFDNHKYSDLFMKENRRFSKQISSKKIHNVEDWFHRYWLDRSYYFHDGTFKLKKKNTRTILENSIQNLDELFQLAKIELICELLNIKNSKDEEKTKNSSLNLSFINLPKSNENKIQSIKELYYKIALLFKIQKKRDNSNEINLFLNFLNNYNLNQTETGIIYSNLLNLTSNNIKYMPYKKSRQIHFNLLYSKLNSKFTKKTKNINPAIITNITILGLELDEKEKVYSTLREWRDKFPPKNKELFLNIIQAYIHFYERNYHKCISTIYQITDTSFGVKGIIDLLNIRSLFELSIQGNLSADKRFFHFCNNYKNYIKKLDIKNDIKRGNLSFITYTLELHQIYIGKSKVDLKEFKKEILNSLTPLKLWFEKKINELTLLNRTSS